MASRLLLLFFVFLSLTGLSEENCHDHFFKEHWNGTNMTDLILLVNATSTEKILNCTIWKNRGRELFDKINKDCFKGLNLDTICTQTTEGKHKIHAFHFRCFYARLYKVNYTTESAKEIYEDCQNFSSEINTLQQLWNSLDNVPHMSQRTETSTQTWQIACILVLLVLSITGNLMQGLNSFLQTRKLKMKQKQMSAECICLNPDVTAAEKSPEEGLSYSNESVH
ncbi:uncharacterized protein LOC106938745 isoform X3 [Poecilia latipinna]|uniref:uncharacterized protein LOC106938745 isoform X3 n=1 Tax=Poecilia latipinna TaxID=48699 RepID=UPI00072DE63A|nr:PREDICTED: uncharacterized protein LOC106938745 isoform X3 [Poecilia latipinna]